MNIMSTQLKQIEQKQQSFKKDYFSFLHEDVTKKTLCRSFYVLAEALRKKENVLIVNTNPTYSKLCDVLLHTDLNVNSISQFKNSHNISTCFYKWTGGTLTNYKQVVKSIHSYIKFSDIQSEYQHLINKNQKLKKAFKGYITTTYDISLLKYRGASPANMVGSAKTQQLNLSQKPDLLFCMNPQDHKHLILEAKKLHIPIIALVDPDISYDFHLKIIDYPILCNATSFEFLFFILQKLNFYFK